MFALAETTSYAKGVIATVLDLGRVFPSPRPRDEEVRFRQIKLGGIHSFSHLAVLCNRQPEGTFHNRHGRHQTVDYIVESERTRQATQTKCQHDNLRTFKHRVCSATIHGVRRLLPLLLHHTSRPLLKDFETPLIGKSITTTLTDRQTWNRRTRSS